MKILLTGATGFVGSYVYKRLVETNHALYVVSRGDITNSGRSIFYQLDILNYQATNQVITEIKPDLLIHLAWDVTHGDFWDAPNNKVYAAASINLFNSFLENGGKKIIAIGTCAEYPTSSESVLEDQVYDGELSCYGSSKKSVFEYLKYKYTNKLCDITWIRIFGIYGPYENENRFFPKVINAIKNNVLFKINYPDIFVDYVYVNDVAEFIVRCIEINGLGAINIGTGISISLTDLFNVIKNYIETKDFKIINTIVKPNSKSRIPNCEKLHKLGFKFSLQEGLDIMYYQNGVN